MTWSSAGGGVRGAYKAPRRWRQFAIAALLLAVCRPAAAQPAKIEVQRDVAYGPLPAEIADLYRPVGGPARRPAVVMIHGGGWVEGSRHANDGMAEVIAGKGAVVFNIDYRLAALAQPDTRWPAQLVDAQLAVRFLRAHAAEFGIDPARIGAMGDSAGAQLAVFLGVLPHVVPGDQAELYPGERPDVAAVVDQYGPMDLPGMGQAAAGSIEAMFGTEVPAAAALATTSPLPVISGHSAPVYIIHGQADRVVPIVQSLRLRDVLRAHGVPVTVVTYAGDHAYDGLAGPEIFALQVAAADWLVARLR